MLADAVHALGLPPETVVEPAGGASGDAWRVHTGAADYVLRVASSSRLTDSRLMAMEAARTGGLPAPELIRRSSTPQGEVVLLSWLPGTPMFEALVDDPSAARTLGRLAGDTQRRLHRVVAPVDVIDVASDGTHPFDAGRDVAWLPHGSALLHLDWHPLNLLVDDSGTTICGIVDWDNARRGHPLLDLARTDGIVRFAPSLIGSEALRTRLAEFHEGWVDGYGPAAAAIPPSCHLWAGRVMLADVGHRFADRPDALDDLRRWTASFEPARGPTRAAS